MRQREAERGRERERERQRERERDKEREISLGEVDFLVFASGSEVEDQFSFFGFVLRT